MGQHDSGLVCLDTRTGQVEWTLPIGFVWGTPAVGPDGAIYVTTWGNTCDVYRVRDRGDTATVEWQLPFSSNLSGGVAVSRDGIVYVVADVPASSFRALVAIDSAGATLWKDTTHLRRELLADNCPPVIDGQGRLLVGDAHSTLFCFNPDGSVAWTYDGCSFYSGSLIVGNSDEVILHDGGGGVYCLTSSGGAQWSAEVDCEGNNAPCLSQDGTTVVSEGGFYLTGVGPDGRMRWEFSIWDSLELDRRQGSSDEGEGDPSPLVGPDGNLYLLGEIGLVCVACGNIRPANTPWPAYNHDNARSGWAGRQQR